MGRATVTSLSSLILLLLWAVGCTTPVGTDDGQATDRELDTCAGLMPVDDLGEHLEILANGPEQPAVVTDFSTVVMVATCREDFTAPVVSLESTASADPGGGGDEVGAFGLVVIGEDPKLRVAVPVSPNWPFGFRGPGAAGGRGRSCAEATGRAGELRVPTGNQ